MCYDKVKIANRSKKLHRDRSKIRNYTNCGKCGECRTNKQNEYEVRNFYEYIDTVKDGGFVFVDTFTYDPDHVPHNLGFLTFRAKDYRLFMMNVRNRLYKLGFDPANNPSHSLKYFWTSEYGGQYKRPHYHCLFFVKFDLGCDNIHDRLLKFNEIVEQSWDLGRNDRRWIEWHINKDTGKWEAPLGIESKLVNAQGAISYVSKYVTKDCDFEEIFEKQKYSVPQFFDDLFDVNKPNKRLYSANEKLTQFFNDIKPFHRQSNGLGSCISKYVSEDDIINNRIPLLDEECHEVMYFPLDDRLHGYKTVKSPYYLDRKLFYDYNPEDKCFKIKAEMKEKVLLPRLEHNRHYIEESLSQVLDKSLNVYFKNFECYAYLNANYNICSEQDMRNIISNILKGRSYDDLSKYILLYHDRLRSQFDHYCYDISEYTNDEYFKFYYLQCVDDMFTHTHSPAYSLDDLKKEHIEYIKKIAPFKQTSDGKTFDSLEDHTVINKKFYDWLYGKTYNALPCFQGFDKLISLYNVLVHYYNSEKQRQYIFEQKQKSQYKNIYHTSYV